MLLLPDSSAEAMVVGSEIVSKVSRFNMNKSCSNVVVSDCSDSLEKRIG